MSRFFGMPTTNQARTSPATIATAIMPSAMSGPDVALFAAIGGRGGVLRYQSRTQTASATIRQPCWRIAGPRHGP